MLTHRWLNTTLKIASTSGTPGPGANISSKRLFAIWMSTNKQE